MERTQTTDTQFVSVKVGEVKSASQASCTPLDLETPKVAETVAERTVDEEDAEEMIEMPMEEQIRVAVPGKTPVVPVAAPTATPIPEPEEPEDEGNDEALVVVSIDGNLAETLRIE